MKTGIYSLVGLSKPRSATLTGPKEDFFWAEIVMSEDRIQALWEFCENNWDEPKFAKITYDSLSLDGFPINAKMIELVIDPTTVIL